MEALLVPDELDGHRDACFMIQRLDHLAKRALPQGVHDFVPIGQVVLRDKEIVAPVIVIAIVVVELVHGGLVLVLGLAAHKENLGIVHDFLLFKW